MSDNKNNRYVIAVYKQKNGRYELIKGTERRTSALDIVPVLISDLERRLQDGQIIGTKNNEIAERYKDGYDIRLVTF